MGLDKNIIYQLLSSNQGKKSSLLITLRTSAVLLSSMRARFFTPEAVVTVEILMKSHQKFLNLFKLNRIGVNVLEILESFIFQTDTDELLE